MFPVEPSSNTENFESPLQGLDNVILTPHIGGSTEEAQERIGGEVARKLVDYSITGSTTGAVNFPQVQLPLRPSGARFIHVHRNVPGHAAPAERGLRPARHQHRRAILETAGDLGYVVLDADLGGQDSGALLQQIRSLEGTVGARLVFEH